MLTLDVDHAAGEAALDWLESLRPETTDHELVIANVAEHAVYLNDRKGYWVLNDGALSEAAQHRLDEAAQKAASAGRSVTDDDIVRALELAAEDVVAFYQSHVGTKPGVRVGEPPRPQHPGEWADRSMRLARGYVSSVDGARETRHPY